MEALNLLTWAIDALLGLCLLWLAWWALATPELFRAIVLFVVFSLFLALVWVRLAAPDVALAEAAIGAGLTGALLMSAMARLHAATATPPELRGSPEPDTDAPKAADAGRPDSP